MVILLLLLLGLGACSRPPAPVPPPDRATAMVVAVRADSTAAVKALLDEGMSPDSMASDGTRPLAEAARHGRLASAGILLDAGARMDLPDSSGAMSFDYAVERGHREIATLLTRHAAENAGASTAAIAWFDSLRKSGRGAFSWQRVLDGEIASLGLTYSLLVGRDDVASALRRFAGIDNRTRYAPLAVASRFGAEAAVTAMLSAGANPDLEVRGHLHETPLMEAARDGHESIGRKLIRAGARVDHVDDNGETALMWAVRAGETDYAAMLLAAGANRKLRAKSGDTALDLARSINHRDLVELLDRR